MPDKNIHVRFDAVDYDALAALPPVEDLPPAAVSRRRRAEDALEATSHDAVLAVAPESLATGYKLAREPLTAIRLDALPADLHERVDARTEADLGAYGLLAWGRPRARENRSLREFA